MKSDQANRAYKILTANHVWSNLSKHLSDTETLEKKNKV